MDFKCDIIKILKEVETHDDYKWQLRVVKWCGGDSTLEKRQFQRKGDEWWTMKAKGLTSEDTQFIQANLEEILVLLDE